MSNELLQKRFEAAGMETALAAKHAGSKAVGPALAAILDLNLKLTPEGLKLWTRLAGDLPGAPGTPRASHRHFLAKLIADEKINSSNLGTAINFIKKKVADHDAAWPTADAQAAFEKECGVGIVVSDDDAKAAVAKWFADNGEKEVKGNGGYRALGKVLGALRSHETLKFADQKVVKDSVDAEMEKLLGAKQELTAADKKAFKQERAVAAAPAAAAAAESEEKPEFELMRFPKPEENIANTPENLAAHLKRTGGKVRTRFPPEPNGFLHIGHAKSMNLNFSFAAAEGGTTNMRFDDTNPEAEKQVYIDSIIEDMTWLGWKPTQTRYSSDDFQQLYEWAVDLIKMGKAYVCHQTGPEIKRGRELKQNSPWRDTSVEENLRKFEDMRLGKYEEGAATLRLKMDMQSDVTTMRDLIAYRIKYTPHPHVGDKWCIYPSYDYTHCLVDSIEDITHSLCTLEFVIRRDSYFWLLDALNLYKPVVWEYSRLNITHTVLSKRRLIQLVTSGTCTGWDDPRMPTISGFRRRGYTPDSINHFCNRIGITRSAQEIESSLLEECAREDLNVKAPRRLCVLHPIRIRVRNWAAAVKAASSSASANHPWSKASADEIANGATVVAVANHPKDASFGTRPVDLTETMFIEADDFREVDEKGYKRLAIGATVGLVHIGATLTAVSFERTDGNLEVTCDINFTPTEKARGYIHWVCAAPGKEKPAVAEVRLYENLFMSKTPAALAAEDYLNDVNPNSLTVLKEVFVDSGAANAGPMTHAQFERAGFFVTDRDSDFAAGGKRVWNRVVSLKASNWAKKE